MTPIMKRNETKENAVSPVVGVMLMLVVTIVIAAVVAVFATGVVTTTEAAPVAVLDASIDTTWVGSDGTGTVVLTSLTGDTIDLSKVKVTITDVSDTTKKYTYEKPMYSRTAGQFLKSGNSVALGYGSDPTGYGISLGAEGRCSVESGKLYNVTVVYDDQHILYDKEVVAV